MDGLATTPTLSWPDCAGHISYWVQSGSWLVRDPVQGCLAVYQPDFAGLRWLVLIPMGMVKMYLTPMVDSPARKLLYVACFMGR